jgi:hypothetical protein
MKKLAYLPKRLARSLIRLPRKLVQRLRKFPPRSWRKKYEIYGNYVRSRGKVKYFCIGRNKTGTTSLKLTFLDLGFPVGHQRAAEILFDRHYFAGEFRPIINYCRSARVFQDVPFSCPETFKHLDKAAPGSYQRFLDFIGAKSDATEFPWENKTATA